jgi:hypothetical protein
MKVTLPPKRYLGAGDIHVEPTIMTISQYSPQEEMTDKKGNKDVKNVIYFDETESGLVLNVGRTQALFDLWGDDSDAYIGKRVAMIVVPTGITPGIAIHKQMTLQANSGLQPVHATGQQPIRQPNQQGQIATPPAATGPVKSAEWLLAKKAVFEQFAAMKRTAIPQITQSQIVSDLRGAAAAYFGPSGAEGATVQQLNQFIADGFAKTMASAVGDAFGGIGGPGTIDPNDIPFAPNVC